MENIEQIKDNLSDYDYKFLTNLQRYIDTELIFFGSIKRCDFFMGKRSKDDERQISRWKKLAGYKGRFMRFLVTQIINKNAKKMPTHKNKKN